MRGIERWAEEASTAKDRRRMRELIELTRVQGACEHEGPTHRVETIEVSFLPTDHLDRMAFSLHLIRATYVEGWYLQRANTYYYCRIRGEWKYRDDLRENPDWFAFPSVREGVLAAERLLDKLKVNGFRWWQLAPAESQYQRFADLLAGLVESRAGE